MEKNQIEYVLTQLENGVDPEAVRKALLNAGYSSGDISNLFVEANQLIANKQLGIKRTPPQQAIGKVRAATSPFIIITAIVSTVAIIGAIGFWLFTTTTPLSEENEGITAPEQSSVSLPYSQYSTLEHIDLDVPKHWETAERIEDGAANINFVNPANTGEQLTLTVFSDQLLNMASPVALDHFVIESRSVLESEFDQFEQQEKTSSQVVDVSARSLVYRGLRDGTEYTLKAVYFVRNDHYYELLYLSDGSETDYSNSSVIEAVLSSIVFQRPIDPQQHYSQNEALIKATTTENFILVKQINFFVEEMSDSDNAFSLVCSLAQNPTSGLTQLAGLDWNCVAGTSGFAIDFKLPSGYYCVDSIGNNTFGGTEPLATVNGTCIDP